MPEEVFITVTISLVIAINVEDDISFSWFFRLTMWPVVVNSPMELELWRNWLRQASWRRFVPWKHCQKITADTKQLYVKWRVIIEVPQYHPLSLKNELQRSPKSCKMTSESSVCGTSHSSQAYMQPRYIYHKELYTTDNKFNLKFSVSRCTLPIFFS